MSKVSEDIRVEDNTVDSFAVYIGGLTSLKDITKELVCNTEYVCGYPMTDISLKEIQEQAESLGYTGLILITVITNEPFKGAIYQYGNYRDGQWHEIGQTQGYA